MTKLSHKKFSFKAHTSTQSTSLEYDELTSYSVKWSGHPVIFAKAPSKIWACKSTLTKRIWDFKIKNVASEILKGTNTNSGAFVLFVQHYNGRMLEAFFQSDFKEENVRIFWPPTKATWRYHTIPISIQIEKCYFHHYDLHTCIQLYNIAKRMIENQLN